MKLNNQQLNDALILLNAFLERSNLPAYYLIVCGGSALITTNLINRVTKDIDILALCDMDMNLIDPEPLPVPIIEGALEVAENLNLPEDWLNNGPSRGDGGTFQARFASWSYFATDQEGYWKMSYHLLYQPY